MLDKSPTSALYRIELLSLDHEMIRFDHLGVLDLDRPGLVVFEDFVRLVLLVPVISSSTKN